MKTITKLFLIGIVLEIVSGAMLAQAQAFNSGLNQIVDSMVTNGAVAVIGGKSLTKSDTYQVGAIYAYNITTNAAVIGGVDRLFTTGASAQSDNFTLAGGFQLSAQRPLFGSTNFIAHGGVATMVGTPMSGQNGGNIMNLNRVFGYVDIFKFTVIKTPAVISLGAAYGNRTGCGSQFDGN